MKGGLTGFIEAIICYPTEFVKTQLQLQSKSNPAIWLKTGPRPGEPECFGDEKHTILRYVLGIPNLNEFEPLNGYLLV